ncbi:MAG: FadR/GntR family transcriptional regulator [Microbacterium sp.]
MSEYTRRGVHGTTVEVLGARILDGGLEPGETLDLQRIGAELDVSMTALREAIKVLTAKGLLGARQRRGTFVRPRSEWNLLDTDVMRWRYASGNAGTLLHELLEVRAVVEPSAAALAAERRGDADVETLREAVEQMAAAHPEDPEAMIAADVAFHKALLQATGNELFAQMAVFLDPALSLRDELVHGHDVDDPVPSHAAVVDAIDAGDTEAARDAMGALLAQSAADAATVLDDEETTH